MGVVPPLDQPLRLGKLEDPKKEMVKSRKDRDYTEIFI
jgi:hypothetical protein